MPNIFTILIDNILKERNVSRHELAIELKCDDATLSRWLRRASSIPFDKLQSLIDAVSSDGIDRARLVESYNTVVNFETQSFLREETSKRFEEQLSDLQELVSAVSTRLEHYDVSTASPEPEKQWEEFKEQVSKQITELQQTGKQLTAPVLFPPTEDMQVQLVNIHSLDRLEEYRSDQATWFAAAGLFLGAILGIFVN